MDSEIPSWWAFTVVAPIVRFNALEIFATPTFFLASDFISRRSDEVHGRRVVLFLVGILSSLLWERAFYPQGSLGNAPAAAI
jgi:hypothetical protein